MMSSNDFHKIVSNKNASFSFYIALYRSYRPFYPPLTCVKASLPVLDIIRNPDPQTEGTLLMDLLI